MAVVSSRLNIAGRSSSALFGSPGGVVPRFYFAWVDEVDSTWSSSFAREDEVVFSFGMKQTEGEFATLDLTVRARATRGLLSPTRKQWAWLSYDDGLTVTPLFFGRVSGVPRDISPDLTKLQFVARPKNWRERKSIVAEGLKVAPFFDPVWIAEDKRSDPDAVLESRPLRWHFDPVTHEVTTSHITAGEDGVLDFGTSHFEGTLSAQLSGTPLRRVNVSASVAWTQRAVGFVDLTLPLMFKAWLAGSPSWTIGTYTGNGLFGDWPTSGQQIGGGWSIGFTALIDATGRFVDVSEIDIPLGNGQRAAFPLVSFYPLLAVRYDARRSRTERVTFSLVADVQSVLSDAEDEADVLTLNLSSNAVGEPVDSRVEAPAWTPSTAYLVNDYRTNGGNLYRCVQAGTSAGSGGPSGTGSFIADLTAAWAYVSTATSIDLTQLVRPWQPATYYNVGDRVFNDGLMYVCTWPGTSAGSGGPTGLGGPIYDPLDAGLWHWNGLWFEYRGLTWWQESGGLPVGDLARRSYFLQDRGRRSLEWLIAAAAVRLRQAARCVRIAFEVPFEDGLQATLRHSAKIDSDALPGGTATGKIVGYVFSADGTTGDIRAQIEIACTVGNGGTQDAADNGDGDYVDDSYVLDGYQTASNRTIQVSGLDGVIYSEYVATSPRDDNLDFATMTWREAVIQLDVINGPTVQQAVIEAGGHDINAVADGLNAVPTMVDLYLKPVTGAFETDYSVAVSDLKLSKTIDLEAD